MAASRGARLSASSPASGADWLHGMPLLACAWQADATLPMPPLCCRPAASHNWLKLRAFGLTQYDAVLLVDSSAYIAADISPLFDLPTDFAAGWDQVRGWALVGRRGEYAHGSQFMPAAAF